MSRHNLNLLTMKKIVLLFTGLLMGLTTVTAAETTSATLNNDLDLTSRYRYAQPIVFLERGVEFLIFADGSFDFNTDFINAATNDNGYYTRQRANTRSRRSRVNTTHSAPGRTYNHFGSRGARPTHDYLGRVRRINSVFISYDRIGRVKRVGSVYMGYKHGLLTRVGGLHIKYNGRGKVIRTQGFVNRSNQDCSFCSTNGCTMDHYNAYDTDNQWNNNDDFYYYKKNGKAKKQKKLKKFKKHNKY